jgi:hypothetical protein
MITTSILLLRRKQEAGINKLLIASGFALAGDGDSGFPGHPHEQTPPLFLSISDRTTCYSTHPVFQAAFFLSNNVYNMEKIAPYIDRIYTYSYTSVPHIIPFFFGLQKGTFKVFMSEKKPVTYIFPGWEYHWSYVEIMPGMATISDLLILKKRQLNSIRKVFSYNFNHIRFYKSCLLIENRSLRMMVYRRCFYAFYYYRYSITDWCCYLLFTIQHYSHIDFIRLVRKIKPVCK